MNFPSLLAGEGRERGEIPNFSQLQGVGGIFRGNATHKKSTIFLRSLLSKHVGRKAISCIGAVGAPPLRGTLFSYKLSISSLRAMAT